MATYVIEFTGHNFYERISFEAKEEYRAEAMFHNRLRKPEGDEGRAERAVLFLADKTDGLIEIETAEMTYAPESIGDTLPPFFLN